MVSRVSWTLVLSYAVLSIIAACQATPACAQMGGGGMGGGGGAQPPAADTRPKFREHVHSLDGLAVRREKGDAIVAEVRIVGNRRVSIHRIMQELQTRANRFFDDDTVLSDVRRLNDMGSFDHVTYKTEEIKKGEMRVTFTVHEREIITQVIFHGNRGLNDRELTGRSGLAANDPLNEFSIESGRRRLIDYYQGEGFNQVSVLSSVGVQNDPNAVIFRINEGPKERISKIHIEGSTIVSESRLKKIINSRGPMAGVIPWVNNTADMQKIKEDVDVLAAYYHNLGFLTATVGHHLEYDESGKWLTVTYVVNEGPRFRVNEIQIVGNEFITEQSLRNLLELKPGDTYDGTSLQGDVGKLVYGYGELGFIYAEVDPQTVMRDEDNMVDLIYKISEGDRWKVGQIRVNIDGEPHLMRETTMLNLVDLREGDWINRRTLEVNRSRLERSQLLEVNPQIADPPDIKVVPNDDLPADY